VSNCRIKALQRAVGQAQSPAGTLPVNNDVIVLPAGLYMYAGL
jgi:hypothetical protein